MTNQNSPNGNDEIHFSSYHRGSPMPDILQEYLEETDHKDIPKLNHLIKEFLEKIEQKTVLDVGCGLGSVLSEGFLYYGLKPENLYSLDSDRENFKQDVYDRQNKIIGLADNISLKDNFVDLVHSNEMTLDNLQINYESTLREICRVLKKGGVYLANEHFDIISNAREFNTGLFESSQELLPIINDIELLDKIGFNPVVRIKYFNSNEPHAFTFYAFQKKI